MQDDTSGKECTIAAKDILVSSILGDMDRVSRLFDALQETHRDLVLSRIADVFTDAFVHHATAGKHGHPLDLVEFRIVTNEGSVLTNDHTIWMQKLIRAKARQDTTQYNALIDELLRCDADTAGHHISHLVWIVGSNLRTLRFGHGNSTKDGLK